jgi:3-phenylpropionate/cinnamic acid dioxygenase small subunit
MAETARGHGGVPAGEPLTAVSQLLYLEAALLDERRFEEWLDLYAEDAVLWVPQAAGGAPSRTVSIAYDDRARMGERVQRLRSRFAHAQDPPSATCRLVGNVRITGRAEGNLEVASSLILAEVRRGAQSLYCGHVEHRLRPHGEGFKIRRKTVRLVNADLPLGNLSFLL